MYIFIQVLLPFTSQHKANKKHVQENPTRPYICPFLFVHRPSCRVLRSPSVPSWSSWLSWWPSSSRTRSRDSSANPSRRPEEARRPSQRPRSSSWRCATAAWRRSRSSRKWRKPHDYKPPPDIFIDTADLGSPWSY